MQVIDNIDGSKKDFTKRIDAEIFAFEKCEKYAARGLRACYICGFDIVITFRKFNQ